ncbi:MAG TPA: hypothetical protein VGC20_12585 [bacterium]
MTNATAETPRFNYARLAGFAYLGVAICGAFAEFFVRFGVIGCLNVKLHRKGQRHDPMWERFAPSIPFLFGRAAALLRAFG